MDVALLSGGTGGAKLARGLADVAGRLTVIANTGDDTWIYGAHVSPDPDLVTYWLADAIDERGYGIRGDTWKVMEALEAAGHPAWFRLGDRDLAMCLLRSEQLERGSRPTKAHAAVVDALGVQAHVLPMCDEPVRTRITAGGREWPFQEFMVIAGGEGPIDAVDFAGVLSARPTREVVEALGAADAIVIGPSNPIASIGPILAVPGMRERVAGAGAPVVAVSPFVGGEVLKGPTLAFCRHAGIEPSAAGLAEHYGSLIDGIVADEPVDSLPSLHIETRMDDAASRERVARKTLDFAASLGR